MNFSEHQELRALVYVLGTITAQHATMWPGELDRLIVEVQLERH